jgi:hypothetical protein
VIYAARALSWNAGAVVEYGPEFENVLRTLIEDGDSVLGAVDLAVSDFVDLFEILRPSSSSSSSH